jgi:outer membrane protein assembly factor BamE (lipoprotein component of BamABCDE complex)
MMYADLVEHRLRKGMTKREIKQLLGNPDNQDDPWDDGRDVWNYLLGGWSGLRIEGDYLSVEFDKSGVVVAYYRWQS